MVMEEIYYYRWGANNVGIVSDDPDIIREIMAVLSDAQDAKIWKENQA